MNFKEKTDISILISGEAGQGIQSLESIMLKIFKLSGYCVFAYSEFMSRIRGGNNSTEWRYIWIQPAEPINIFTFIADHYNLYYHGGNYQKNIL
jgi:Pyruvate/2-oxoacid:ferredoxin oxidoreductase gamma subunit